MQFIGLLIFFVIIYIAYQTGRIKGRAEMILEQRRGKKRSATDNIEEADYEEIK
ncbi:MAG: hypothetical protein R6V47_00825 [Candidatus Delongbacteria bacterium]